MTELAVNITDIARRELAASISAPVRSGASVLELAELFQICEASARSIFEYALIRDEFDEVRLRRNLYSRAGVVELLHRWNGRPLPYPDRPLLTASQASEFLTSRGVVLARATLDTWRSKHRRKGPRFVRIGQRVIRYRTQDLNAYLAERIA